MAAEQLLVDLDLFSVVPGSQVHMSVVEVLLFDVWDKARLDLAVLKGSPVEVVEPWVVLDLLATVDAQPLRSLPHQALVDEVSCLTRVAHWDLVLLHRCLLL